MKTYDIVSRVISVKLARSQVLVLEIAEMEFRPVQGNFGDGFVRAFVATSLVA